VILFALSLLTVLYWDTHMTWWSYIICMMIPALFLVPIGMIQAVTNWQYVYPRFQHLDYGELHELI
jgi:hypothetical protein